MADNDCWCGANYTTKMHELLGVVGDQGFIYNGKWMCIDRKGQVLYAPYGRASIVRLTICSADLCNLINNLDKVERKSILSEEGGASVNSEDGQ